MSLQQYLDIRGVTDVEYRRLILAKDMKRLRFRLCSVDGYDYMVSHFLGASTECGYGLIATNQVLGLQNSNQIAIALIEGDDVICLNIEDGSVNLWLLEGRDGERLTVASSFRSFLEQCIET